MKRTRISLGISLGVSIFSTLLALGAMTFTPTASAGYAHKDGGEGHTESQTTCYFDGTYRRGYGHGKIDWNHNMSHHPYGQWFNRVDFFRGSTMLHQYKSGWVWGNPPAMHQTLAYVTNGQMMKTNSYGWRYSNGVLVHNRVVTTTCY